MRALLGIPNATDSADRVVVTDQLTLRATPTGDASICIIDAGLLPVSADWPDGLLVAVLRGPCYLSLRALVTSAAGA